MITITLGGLVNAEAALSRLCAERLPATTAYQVAKLMRLAAVETKHFHVQRQAVYKELGVERPATDEERATGVETMIEVAPEHLLDLHKRIQEHADVSVSLDAKPVDLATLGDISPADLMALGPLVTGGDD